ncbi:MAG: SDR family oxidoreductase, partial [Phaeodactylibacter sp.]|nr:SDR family oxidoreductase [Phaeodactylibacter sp.]
SRLQVERVLGESTVPLTALRAGIIIGSGSASFEIIRDLVEKLPVMVAPKWLETRCQPIAIRDVIRFLTGVILREDCYNQNFDIGCDEVLTYREMLQGYANARGLKRFIFTVPIMTPRLSSYWLHFVTSTTYELAVNLVNSMKVDVICRDNRLAERLGLSPIPYQEAVQLAFDKIQQNMVVSSWKDSLVSSSEKGSLSQYIEVPEHGCFEDKKQVSIENNTEEQVWRNVLAIGGERGWYYGNALWKLRGLLDKMVGGIGLRRGRTHPEDIYPGDALDFWRVLAADHEEKRLLLYAEMKLPGEAWLEFQIVEEQGVRLLKQKATFRPSGIWGRLYWYLVLPFHFLIFNRMIRNIERFRPSKPVQKEAVEVEELDV